MPRGQGARAFGLGAATGCFVVPAVAGLIAGGLLLGLSALASPSGAAPAPLRTIPHTDLNPYGANFFLQHEAEAWKMEKTLQLARQAGLGWVKQHFPWESLELRQGVFWNEALNKPSWDKYDEIVSLAEKYGLQVIARLDRPPAWARGNQPNPPEGQTPPVRLEDYGDFVYEVVKRYGGRIGYYQLWNEPNLAAEWGGRPPNPAEYVALLKEGYRRAKEADPNAFILSAPLAQTLERSPRALSDIDYLEAMYAQGAKGFFDILFANAYGFDAPPEEAADPQALNFRRVLLLRQVMERHGDAHKPVWFNEFGWNAAPAEIAAEKLKWRRVSEAQQAEYTVRAVRQARAEWPWAGVFNIWYFRQDGHFTPDDAQYYFRMVDVGFTPRLVFKAIKEATQGLSVAQPGAYQETNPALKVENGWRMVVDEEASGGSALVCTAPRDSLTINFEGSGLALVVGKGPQSGILLVTVDGRESGVLPLNRESRSYLDLYSPRPTMETIIVASGLGRGIHRGRLTVAAERNLESSGHGCRLDGFIVVAPSGPAWDRLGLGVAAVAGAAGLMLWWRGLR